MTGLRFIPARGRGITLIAGGSALGQLVALAATPLLSRLYTPTEYGLFAVATAAATVLSSVMSLRLDAAVAVPREDSDARALARLGIAASAVMTGALLVATALAPAAIAQRIGLGGHADWLWPIPVAAGLTSAYLIATQVAIRQRSFDAIGFRNALQPSVTSAAQLALAPISGPMGLLFGYVIGRIAGVTSLLRRSGLLIRGGGPSRTQVRRLTRTYWEFPVLGMPAKVLNTIGIQIPPTLFAAAYAHDIAGQFSMAYTVLALPVALIGAAVGQVFLADYSRATHESTAEARRRFRDTSARLAGVGLLLLVGALSLSRWAFPLVLGAEWQRAGAFAQALALASALRMLALPVTPVLWVARRQKAQLVLDAARVAATLGVFAAADRGKLDSVSTAWLYSAGMAAIYAVTWLLCWQTVRTTRQAEDQ